MSEEIPEIWKAINFLANSIGVLVERVKRLEENEKELRGRREALRLLLVKTKDFENG